MKSQLSFLVLALALLSACGNDNVDRKDTAAEGTDPTEENPAQTAASLADDEEAAGQAVTAEIDDVISAAVEENDADADAGASLVDAEADQDGKVTVFRECKEEGANAVVAIRRQAERTFSMEGPVRKIDSTFSAYSEKLRTWSKEGGAIKCGENLKFAAVHVADMVGVKLDVTFKHERKRQTTLVNKKKNETTNRSMSYTAEGDRHIVWKAVEEVGDTLLIHKEATGSAERKLVIQKKDGTVKTLEGSVSSVEGAPLAIVVERNKDTLAWISRTIESGSRVATLKDGGKIETSFDDVKYTAEKRCTAVSGKITGKIFKKDEAEASVTFEIVFDGDGKTVTMSNGKEFDYAPEGCDLDEPVKAVDAATKEAVTPAETP